MGETRRKAPSGVYTNRLTDSDYKQAERASAKVDRMRQSFEADKRCWRSPVPSRTNGLRRKSRTR